jgi:isochorismate pyruvate lyase
MENPIKKPSDCKTIDEVRQEIDRIDKEVIRLFGERFSYIKEVVKYKVHSEDGILAKARYDKVIEERTNWAKSYELDPKVIDKIYRILMDYFIEEQFKIANLKKQ